MTPEEIIKKVQKLSNELDSLYKEYKRIVRECDNKKCSSWCEKDEIVYPMCCRRLFFVTRCKGYIPKQ